jgi:hypothetical protein
MQKKRNASNYDLLKFFKKNKTMDTFSDTVSNSSEPTESNKNETENSIHSPPSNSMIITYDIGLFLNTCVDDHTRYNLLKNHWNPPKDFKFPYSIENRDGKEIRRYLSQKHLDLYPWTVFSENQNGLFCKYCSLFYFKGHGTGNKNAMPLGILVTKPMVKFKNLLGNSGDLNSHQNTKYHGEAVLKSKDFINNYENPEKKIINLVNTQRMRTVDENRKRIRPIIQTLLFLARQNIALRGHRDDGNLIDNMDSNQNSIVGNEGNFRELLKFRIESGDIELKRHFEISNSNATYISKTSQNEILSVIGDIIIENILKKISFSTFYSIMFDETTDMSHTSQLCLVIRYVYNNSIQEDFITFIDPHKENFDALNTEPKLSGEVLGKTILKIMKKLGLVLKNCVGISTDGCSVMSSKICGAIRTIQNKIPRAILCPCFNYV